MSCKAGLVICVGLAAIAPRAASAEPPPKQVAGPPDELRKRAVELHDQASALYEKGRYRAAIEKLEAALALDPTGKELVYNLALIHEKLAELDAAHAYY